MASTNKTETFQKGKKFGFDVVVGPYASRSAAVFGSEAAAMVAARTCTESLKNRIQRDLEYAAQEVK